MAKIDLQGDEFVVMENRNFTVRSIPLDAILTTRRLIFIDSRKNAIPQRNIPLTTIHNIELGENTEKDQTVTLSLITESGEIRQMVLTLSRQAGSERKWEYDEWVTKLKEHTVSTNEMAQMSTRDPADQVARMTSVAEPGEGFAILPKSQDGVQSSAPNNLACPDPAKVPKKSPFFKIAAIILVIVVIIGVVIVFGQITKGKTQPAQNMVPTSVMTTVETPIPTPIPSPTPDPTPVPRPQYIIPSTGTWVRIQYPGNFVGYVRIRGIFTQVNNTVEQFIQLPASEGVISGSIGKQDGSVDNLTVGIYKDGALVFTKNTRKPLGEIDFQYTL
jgi:hypothetical protein